MLDKHLYRNYYSYMKKRDQLSSVLHALMHIAASPQQSLTSEALAVCLSTHPVVVRRTMASLREAGLVASTAGRGGGWTLARSAADITLGDVYAALGESLFQPRERPAGAHAGCLIEHAIAGVMDGVVREAEALLAQRFNQLSLADLATQLKGAQHGQHHHGH